MRGRIGSLVVSGIGIGILGRKRGISDGMRVSREMWGGLMCVGCILGWFLRKGILWIIPGLNGRTRVIGGRERGVGGRRRRRRIGGVVTIVCGWIRAMGRRMSDRVSRWMTRMDHGGLGHPDGKRKRW